MALRSGLDESEGMNMTPMIDVVFNLLIFFLLGSAYANDERRIDLELPTVKQAIPLVDTPEELAINVASDGQLTAAGRKVTLEELGAALEKARAAYSDQAVAIRGSRDVPYQRVAEVIALCRKSGIARLDVLVLEQ